MSNYTQQCQRPDCDASFDGAMKSVFCSDRCEIASLRAELESLNDTLKPWTTKTARLLRQYVDDTSEGFECLPKCDSYGHEEECPTTNHVAAWRLLRAENERLKQEIADARVTIRALPEEIANEVLRRLHSAIDGGSQ